MDVHNGSFGSIEAGLDTLFSLDWTFSLDYTSYFDACDPYECSWVSTHSALAFDAHVSCLCNPPLFPVVRMQVEFVPFSYVAAAGNVVTYLGGIQVIVTVLVFLVTKLVQSSECCRRLFEPSMLHEDDEVRGASGWGFIP